MSGAPTRQFGPPLEDQVRDMVQALVLSQLAAGRKLYPMDNMIEWSFEGSEISSVKLNLRFLPPGPAR